VQTASNVALAVQNGIVDETDARKFDDRSALERSVCNPCDDPPPLSAQRFDVPPSPQQAAEVLTGIVTVAAFETFDNHDMVGNANRLRSQTKIDLYSRIMFDFGCACLLTAS